MSSNSAGAGKVRSRNRAVKTRERTATPAQQMLAMMSAADIAAVGNARRQREVERHRASVQAIHEANERKRIERARAEAIYRATRFPV